VVGLWVEGFFEVFATTVIAFFFTRLGLIRLAFAARSAFSRLRYSFQAGSSAPVITCISDAARPRCFVRSLLHAGCRADACLLTGHGTSCRMERRMAPVRLLGTNADLFVMCVGNLPPVGLAQTGAGLLVCA